MTPSQRAQPWRWLQWAVIVIAVLVLFLVALLIALRSSNQSEDAAQQAADTSTCVNRVQAERAYATSIVNNAQLRKTRAEVDYLRDRISRTDYAAAVAEFSAEQKRADAYRAAHPAGRC